MSQIRHVLLAAFLVWLAAILQGRAAHSISLGVAEPDFALVALACSALLLGGNRGILLGFWAGLLTAAALPLAFGSVFASRIAAGVFAGSLQRSLIRDNLVVPPLVSLLTTLLAEGIYFVMAPGLAIHHLRHWAAAVGGEAVYNGVLALPVYFVMRLFQIGRMQADPFARHS